MKPCAKEILFEDNHILVALKPPNLLTQPDESGRESLEEWVKEEVRKKRDRGGAVFLHAIHRLDRPVSGLVLFAKTSKALSRLNEAMRTFSIEKSYIAEVEGDLRNAKGTLEHFLVRKEHHSEAFSREVPGGKPSKLSYRVMEKRKGTTLVWIDLFTGRYHQIRAQFQAIGHPIVGDVKYGAQRKQEGVIHLHGARVKLIHPVSQEEMVFEAPPFLLYRT